MYHSKTTEVAKGRWRGILMTLGMPDTFLQNNHGPCPLCGGKDRFRWDNKEGSGSFICGQCGAGDGMELAKKYTNSSFIEIAGRIDEILSNIKPKLDGPQHQRRDMSEDQIRDHLRHAYSCSAPVIKGDPVDIYLVARGIHEHVYPTSLRFAAQMKNGEGGLSDCMLAIVSGPDGKAASMHRTFIADGKKALISAPRKMMPGKMVDGGCVRLTDVCEHIGLAEGIETSMSACNRFDLPVWAALNTSMMQGWIAPEEVKIVTIFGDNDTNFAGHKAAYALAHRLALTGIEVDVVMPPDVGDWNDVINRIK